MRVGHLVHLSRRTASLVALLLVAPAAVAQNSAPSASRAALDQIFGRKGTASAGGVVRYGFPRSDLSVRLDNVDLKTGFALGGWAAFKEDHPGQALVMGDLVLLEDEVPAVMRTLQAGGVEQTALHNHLLREQPHVVYMHIHAHGNSQAIAHTIRDALALTKTPLTTLPSPAPAAAAPPALDTVGIAAALHTTGKWNGGIYQVSVPRSETITDDRVEIPPSMGVATAINFQPTGGGKAAITGDFVLRATEVNPVIKALRENGIEVTAVHTHMLTEQPKLYFMHFWANDDGLKLARGLAAALDRTASKR
ncbi:MAG TPA: DUF1259 domain-containing protein [Gemmatimonadaceae bacterium]|jgi:hypothetical protein|nr:DUF1259 domain-containing protein [Gemmatimonadaceae bacterium]